MRTLESTDEPDRVVLSVVSETARGAAEERIAGYAAGSAAGDTVGLSKAFSEHV